jgi:hypothetical protein
VVLIALPLFLALRSARAAETGGPWRGVDETVVEQIAKEHHREARPPLLRTDQGDLALFVFLLAGACGGFAAGYYWRKLIDARTRDGSGGNGSRGADLKGRQTGR